jgi:ATP-dependent Lhr-like helicase
MPLNTLHPIVHDWFAQHFGSATEPQARAWPAIRSGENVLVSAPTGSGKTLAAFLICLDDLVRAGLDGSLPDTTQVLYVSPLKALSNDIHKNLDVPLSGIATVAAERGLLLPAIRTAVRTGDTRWARTPADGQAPAAHSRHHPGVALHSAYCGSQPAGAAQRENGHRR